MSEANDACLPDPVRDFIFDLHDSVRRSMIPEEQDGFYNGSFRELSSKYFSNVNSTWPSAEAIASECENDPLFLAFYREMTHRHYHSITSRLQLRDHFNGWNIYKTLFDMLLDNADDADLRLLILPEWAFEIMNEFVYQFQGFCQFRLSKKTEQQQADVEALKANRDAWAIETVYHYLYRLKEIGFSTSCPSPAHKYLGEFAVVALSRLECLVTDYNTCLGCLDPVTTSSVVHGVLAARVSIAYHVGVSNVMLRRYKDANSVLEKICSELQQGFKFGSLRQQPGGDQLSKLLDRMLGLLALVRLVCPATNSSPKDSVSSAIREKYGSQISRIETGDEGYEDLFGFACPKFINPAFPDYSKPLPPKYYQEVFSVQARHFAKEMEAQKELRQLRKYLALYKSVSISKLASARGLGDPEVIARLLSSTHRTNQIQSSGSKISTSTLHYQIKGDMVVNIVEKEDERPYGEEFLAQIQHCDSIIKQLNAIPLAAAE